MKRLLISALLICLVLALMLFAGSVCHMPDYFEPGSFPTRSPSMSAMPAEGDAPSAEGGVLPGAEAPAEG